MRGTMLKILACLMVLGCAVPGGAAGGERSMARKTKGGRPGQDKAYSLEDIMKSPKEYLDREVLFYARYATTANLFKTVNTRFNSTHHVNFAVWPDKEVLWEADGRKNVLPTLYIAKNDPENLDVLRLVEKYQVVAITGQVLNVYAGYPWIQVSKIEIIEKPNERLCDQMIEHMQNGHDALKSGYGGAAARHYEQALQFGMPQEFKAKAYEQIAEAYLLDNQLDKARGYLRQAVEVNRNDPIVHLALADVALRMGDAGEALAHCQFALERSGRYPQVYGIMAEARSLLGDYGKAFTDLNTAAGTPGITSREKAMINVRRARIYVRSERYSDAARMYAMVSEPGEPMAGESWLHNEIGLFYERLFLESDDARYLDSAYAAYEEASRLNRMDPAAVYNMAEVEFRRQRLADEPAFNKVVDVIKRVYEIEPDYAPARILEGRILFIEEKFEEAEFRYQSVADQIGEDPIALLALAEAYMDLCRYDEAAETVSVARALQPWNSRVQALGQFLEDIANEMAANNARQRRSYGDWARPSRQSQSQGQRYQEEEPEYEETYEEDGDATNTGVGMTRQKRKGRAFMRVAKKNGAQVEARPAKQVEQRQARPAAQGKKVRPEGAPAKANTLAAGSLYGEYGQQRRNQPAQGRKAPSSRYYEEDERYPQDIQASVRPSMPTESRRGRLPRTHVRLPEDAPSSRSRVKREYESPDSRAPRNHEGEMERRDGGSMEPLDLGYTPGNERMLEENRYYDREEDLEDFREDFGRDYQWEQGRKSREYERESEAEYDEDGYLRFGMIEGVTNAYASMPIGSVEEALQTEADQARIPQAFTFRQDDSPVILADVRSTGSERQMPVRNANVYRRSGMGTTRPAEIIERESIAARLPADTSVMVPPKGGAVNPNGSVRRAEVRLPSSSRGVGMTSDYMTGK